MAYFTTTIDFTNGQQVTSANLDEITSGLRMGSESLLDSTLTLDGSSKLAVGVIAAGNLGADSVETAKIKDGNVTATKLATDSVETAKIKALAVTNAKLAADSVDWDKVVDADKATQAHMQSETASKIVSASVSKFAPGAVKAYGRVSMTPGLTTITGGYNVASATDTGSGRQITLTNAMANTNYVVLANSNQTGTGVNYTIDSATQFTLDGPAENAGREFSFIVLGQLA